MFLKRLWLKDFRIFDESAFSFSPTCNIFYGANGTGKTSILEAIGYLSRGKSFRTTLSKRLIQQGKDQCALTACLQKQNIEHCIGIEIKSSNNRRVHLNNQPVRSIASLTTLMPLIWISPFCLHMFLASPTVRRHFINWGVFHFANDFHGAWRRFNKTLIQRNTALKRRLNNKQISCWHDDFVESANIIDRLRHQYLDSLKPFILKTLAECMLLPNNDLDLHYDRGWPKDFSLKDLLEKSIEDDKRLGYTQFGPHRMDIKFLIDGDSAQDFCSQGQHKLISYVFYLAQGRFFDQVHGYSPIFLIDDLPSELDHRKVFAIATIFSKIGAQIFTSGVTVESFKQFNQIYSDNRLFHVKQSHK